MAGSLISFRKKTRTYVGRQYDGTADTTEVIVRWLSPAHKVTTWQDEDQYAGAVLLLIEGINRAVEPGDVILWQSGVPQARVRVIPAHEFAEDYEILTRKG